MLHSFFLGSSELITRAATRSVTSKIFLSAPSLLDMIQPEIIEQITPLISTSSSALLTNAAVVSATSFSDIYSLIDFSKYWFMFPTCVCVATCAISSGIGGAALFGPIFLIVFPALGPQYMLSSPAAAVG